MEKPELLKWLDRFKHCARGHEDGICDTEGDIRQCIQAEEGIRQLIERVAEWQERAKEDFKMNNLESALKVFDLLKEIRDFNRGDKEEA